MPSTKQVDHKEEDERTGNGYEHQHTCCAGMDICKKERGGIEWRGRGESGFSLTATEKCAVNSMITVAGGSDGLSR